jgi:hypothetical protein
LRVLAQGLAVTSVLLKLRPPTESETVRSIDDAHVRRTSRLTCNASKTGAEANIPRKNGSAKHVRVCTCLCVRCALRGREVESNGSPYTNAPYSVGSERVKRGKQRKKKARKKKEGILVGLLCPYGVRCAQGSVRFSSVHFSSTSQIFPAPLSRLLTLATNGILGA